MNVYEPCFFSKFAAREEPAVDGGSIAPGEFVGCVLLEVDDHLMGGPGKSTSREHRETTAEDKVWEVAQVDTRRGVFLRRTPLQRDSYKSDYDQFHNHGGYVWTGVGKRPKGK